MKLVNFEIRRASVCPDKLGFEEIGRLYRECKDFSYEEKLKVGMAQVSFFSADMCAALGAILYELKKDLHSIELDFVSPKGPTEKTLARNGFLVHYGQEKISSIYHNAIDYKRFDAQDERYFSNYVEEELMRRDEFPRMSEKASAELRESILEIFSNSVLHSQSKSGIFSCGQNFPNKKKLNFMIVDLGVGIPRNVKEHLNTDIGPLDAIEWAMEEYNTTKKGIPGGLGLKIISEFIDFNKGCLKIVSHSGYWEKNNQGINKDMMKHPFPGTVVSMEINTGDTHSYMLPSEQ